VKLLELFDAKRKMQEVMKEKFDELTQKLKNEEMRASAKQKEIE
jgi:hypothetical protein